MNEKESQNEGHGIIKIEVRHKGYIQRENKRCYACLEVWVYTEVGRGLLRIVEGGLDNLLVSVKERMLLDFFSKLKGRKVILRENPIYGCVVEKNCIQSEFMISYAEIRRVMAALMTTQGVVEQVINSKLARKQAARRSIRHSFEEKRQKSEIISDEETFKTYTPDVDAARVEERSDDIDELEARVSDDVPPEIDRVCFRCGKNVKPETWSLVRNGKLVTHKKGRLKGKPIRVGHFIIIHEEGVPEIVLLCETCTLWQWERRYSYAIARSKVDAVIF